MTLHNPAFLFHQSQHVEKQSNVFRKGDIRLQDDQEHIVLMLYYIVLMLDYIARRTSFSLHIVLRWAPLSPQNLTE